MLRHVNEDLLPRAVLGLDHEAGLRLYDGASLAVNDGLAMLVQVGLLVTLHLLRHLALKHLLVHLYQLLLSVLVKQLLRFLRERRSLVLGRGLWVGVKDIEERVSWLV